MWKQGLVVLAVATAISGADQKCGQTKEPSLGVAESDVFPWVGLVYYQKDDKPPETLAMGTLIDSRHVLVPAYVTNPPGKQVLKYIQFGAVDVENAQTAQNHTIEKIFTHPQYSPEQKRTKTNIYEIAVIRLEKPVAFSDSVSPACLPVKDQNYDADHYHFVSYNIGNPAYENIKGRKQVSLLPRVTSAECIEAYAKFGSKNLDAENIASYVCAGDKENDSCTGDAGSPILRKDDNGWTAVAFSIFGPRICRSGIPSAFLTIQPYTEWIQSVVSS